MMRRWWVLLIFIVLLATFPFVFSKKSPTVEINDKKIKVEIAKTPEERSKGLSGRESLDENSGMLFVFESAGIYSIWMSETLIPLDIIWINDNKIAEMTTLEPASPNNIPKYRPKNIANYVLEVNSGFTQKNNIKVGNEVKISIPK